MNAKQTNLGSGTPIVMKQTTDHGKNRVIAAGWLRQRVRSRDGMKIGVTQLELDGSRFELLLAHAAPDHFRKPCERRFEHAHICGVLAESVLVADRLCVAVADLLIEPSSGIFPTGFACHRVAIGAEVLLQILTRMEVGKGADPEFVQT